MKQGTLATRIVMIVLFAAVILYVGVYLIGSFSTPYKTERAYAFQLENVSTVSGYLVRTESVLPSASGLVDVAPREGERVSRTQTIATQYKNEAAFQQQQTLRSLQAQLQQLQSMAQATEEAMDKARLDQEIAATIVQLRQLVSDQKLSRLDAASTALKDLVFQRDYALEQPDQLDTQIANLSGRISTLEQQLSDQTEAVSASASGLYSGVVDGYESVLTETSIRSLTPSAFHDLRPEEADQTAIGKLITSDTWYFVTVLPEDQAEAMAPKASISLRFARGFSEAVSMSIVSVSPPENGETVVVFSCSRYLPQTTTLRQMTADLLFDSYAGLRIPKEALRILEDGSTGVYCVSGLQAEFRAADILYEGDTYYIVTSSPDSKGLKAGDEVFIKGESLYSGKVVS